MVRERVAARRACAREVQQQQSENMGDKRAQTETSEGGKRAGARTKEKRRRHVETRWVTKRLRYTRVRLRKRPCGASNSSCRGIIFARRRSTRSTLAAPAFATSASPPRETVQHQLKCELIKKRARMNRCVVPSRREEEACGRDVGCRYRSQWTSQHKRAESDVRALPACTSPGASTGHSQEREALAATTVDRLDSKKKVPTWTRLAGWLPRELGLRPTQEIFLKTSMAMMRTPKLDSATMTPEGLHIVKTQMCFGGSRDASLHNVAGMGSRLRKNQLSSSGQGRRKNTCCWNTYT